MANFPYKDSDLLFAFVSKLPSRDSLLRPYLTPRLLPALPLLILVFAWLVLYWISPRLLNSGLPYVLTRIGILSHYIVTRLRFLSQDRGFFNPLILGTPSSAYSTMSHTAVDATMSHPAQEPVHPAVGKDTTNSSAVLPPILDEPIVTRKELWSYYCIFSSLSPRGCPLTTCLTVYYNGDNVRRFVHLLPE